MVSLRIFDATGRLARTLVEGVRLAGEHEFTWDGADDRGRDLPSGMYFYTLEAGGERITRRMVLLK
jgi:flagellar hook assembly protein FlgD